VMGVEGQVAIDMISP